MAELRALTPFVESPNVLVTNGGLELLVCHERIIFAPLLVESGTFQKGENRWCYHAHDSEAQA